MQTLPFLESRLFWSASFGEKLQYCNENFLAANWIYYSRELFFGKVYLSICRKNIIIFPKAFGDFLIQLEFMLVGH